mmetsp:Transcript_38068/g.63967  ORF Transcript_38068/g.63967 Transcript_38068/m.63967 type:complete len:316 (+) Transcript_38068:444-1391(+)
MSTRRDRHSKPLEGVGHPPLYSRGACGRRLLPALKSSGLKAGAGFSERSSVMYVEGVPLLPRPQPRLLRVDTPVMEFVPFAYLHIACCWPLSTSASVKSAPSMMASRKSLEVKMVLVRMASVRSASTSTARSNRMSDRSVPTNFAFAAIALMKYAPRQLEPEKSVPFMLVDVKLARRKSWLVKSCLSIFVAPYWPALPTLNSPLVLASYLFSSACTGAPANSTAAESAAAPARNARSFVLGCLSCPDEAPILLTQNEASRREPECGAGATSLELPTACLALRRTCEHPADVCIQESCVVIGAILLISLLFVCVAE